MTDLIARLEAAEGPCRELDCWIHLAANPDIEVMTDGGGYRGEREVVYTPASDIIGKWRGDWEGFASQIAAPTYTSSRDAAVTLVPKGMRWLAQSMEGGRAAVLLQFPGEVLQPTWGKLYANEPIATCIAALKARQTP